MKYIEIYLNERKKEIEQLKQKEINKFKEQYFNCEDNEDISGITMYYISGESLIHILELLNVL